MSEIIGQVKLRRNKNHKKDYYYLKLRCTCGTVFYRAPGNHRKSKHKTCGDKLKHPEIITTRKVRCDSRVGKKAGCIKLISSKNRLYVYECSKCGGIGKTKNSHIYKKNNKTCPLCCRKTPAQRTFTTAKLQYARNDTRRSYRAGINKLRLSDKQLWNLIFSPCHYCGFTPDVSKGERIGIDRLDSKKGYVSANCVPCCKPCNYAKNTYTVAEFREWVERIYNHWISKA